MKIDKTNKEYVKVEMTLQEYNTFARLMVAMDNYIKDYKGGAK